MVEVIKVALNSQEMKAFIELPWKLYQNHRKEWIPPLKVSEEMKFSSGNPFFAHADFSALLALKNGVAVGRIFVSIDHHFVNAPNSKVGHFGFYESINDDEVAQKLYTEAESWLYQRGCSEIHGPINFSIYYSYRFQTSGHKTAPFLGEPRNHDYYPALALKNGYKIHSTWYSWELSVWNVLIMTLHTLLAARLRPRPKDLVRIKLADLNQLESEIKEMYDSALATFQNNYGFAHISKEEFTSAISSMAPFLFPGSFCKAYNQENKVIAFVYGHADMAEAFKLIDGDYQKLDLMKKSRPKRIVWHTLGIDADYRKSSLVYKICEPLCLRTLLARMPVIGALTKEINKGYARFSAPTRSYSVFYKVRAL
ncbi:MAG: hypothetical protein HQK52_08580 [Oligoflexia bacterium]|nr:hypothetical protein [Oligoflexia bacterium]